MVTLALPPEAQGGPETWTEFDAATCLERVRRRDQSAARDLVEHLYPTVIRIVRARLRFRENEEDVSQEIFMKLFARLDQYRGVTPLSHWVSRIAVTTCIDHLRKQRARRELLRSDLVEDELTVLESVGKEKPAHPMDAHAARSLLYRLLDQLPAEDRTVIQLLDLEEKSCAEIGLLTGMKSSTVRTRAFRARRKLQRLFAALESDEAG